MVGPELGEHGAGLGYCVGPLVSSLMYLALRTRPDIAYAVQQLCHYLDCYQNVHWEAAKRVVHYLKGTQELKLSLGGDQPAHLMGHTDSNFATCVDTCQSVSGHCFSLGTGVITWSTRQQRIVTLSSCKAEYVAASEASQELTWICTLLGSIGFCQLTATPLLCDNRGAMVLTEDPSFHACVKHIDTRYHYICERIRLNHLKLHYVNTKDNIADIFTKALPRPAFIYLHTRLGLT